MRNIPITYSGWQQGEGSELQFRTFKNKNIMNRFFYFKVTFSAIALGLFAGLLIYGLLDVDFSNRNSVTKWFLKAFLTAIGTGLVLGILNMFFKIGNFQRKE
jgi:hypothetical protein